MEKKNINFLYIEVITNKLKTYQIASQIIQITKTQINTKIMVSWPVNTVLREYRTGPWQKIELEWVGYNLDSDCQENY